MQQLAGAVLAFRRALQRQHQAEEQALELLFYDPLTQLPNRRLLRERLQQALTRHAPLALLALDLDGFQHINDSCGHQVGDQVLQAVAQRLRTTTQGCEVLARTGSNSFAVLLTGLGHAATNTAAQAERMARSLAIWGRIADPAEVAEAWLRLKLSGKVRHLGVSNMHSGQMALLQRELADPILINQLEMSLLQHDWIDDGTCFNDDQGKGTRQWGETLEYCRLQNIQLQSWGSLGKGWFSGAAPQDAPASVHATASLVKQLAHQYDVPTESLVLALVRACR